MNILNKQDTTLHSGQKSDFKIDCDALTDEDIQSIAYLISKRFVFNFVFGVPEGGLRLAAALTKYCSIGEGNLPVVLVCDDVLTTGGSMDRLRYSLPFDHANVIGVVIFARNKPADWITPVFQFTLNTLINKNMEHFSADKARGLTNRSVGIVAQQLTRAYEQIEVAAIDGLCQIQFTIKPKQQDASLRVKVCDELILQGFSARANISDYKTITITW